MANNNAEVRYTYVAVASTHHFVCYIIDNIPLPGFATVTSHPLPPVHFFTFFTGNPR